MGIDAREDGLMLDYLIEEELLVDMADTIREGTSTTDRLSPQEMIDLVATMSNVGKRYPGSTGGEIFNLYADSTATYHNEATGNYSSASGYNNKSHGIASFVVGESNTATPDTVTPDVNNRAGRDAFVAGKNNTVYGNRSAAIGSTNTVSSTNSLALGSTNTISGNHSLVAGYSNQATGAYQFVTGCYNLPNTNSAFQIGGGNAQAQKNIFDIDKSGNVTAAGSLHIGTKVFVTADDCYGTSLPGSGTEGQIFFKIES